MIDEKSMPTHILMRGSGYAEAPWRGRQEELAPSFVAALEGEGIIPSGKALDGWVFLSPSSNDRAIERVVAERVNQLAAGQRLHTKPRVLCSDIIGAYECGRSALRTGDFEPGVRDQLPVLGFVDTLTFTSLAEGLALPDASVDVIFDRLGALWYSIYDRRTGLSKGDEETALLLAEYARVLKPDGRLVVDASLARGLGIASTYDLMCDHGFVPEKYDLRMHVCNHAQASLAVLEKN